MPGPAVELRNVRVVRDGVRVLEDVSWTVDPADRWVILGPNGSGKTTLLQLVTGYLHPSSGTADVLGWRLGRTDVRSLRERIAITSGAVARALSSGLTALDVAVTGRTGALAPWWHSADDSVVDEARGRLGEAGLKGAEDRPFAVLSEGERQRVLLVRMRMALAELFVFDEPAAGLDLGAREQLVADLAGMAADPATPAIVFVTHHVEEIPPGFTSLLLLRAGRVVAAGPLSSTLTGAALGETFGLPLEVTCSEDGGRYAARLAPDSTKGRSADPAL